MTDQPTPNRKENKLTEKEAREARIKDLLNDEDELLG